MVQEYPDFLVCIRTFTYNHKELIQDALNGFVIQETEFPYVVCIIDDASTDGTQNVVKSYVTEQFNLDDSNVAYERETEYAYITFAQHRTNKNCYFVVHYLKYNHYQIGKKKTPYLAEWRDKVKYEALCEGDDYWTDALKLQKQVDILNNNPDCSLVITNGKVLNAITGSLTTINPLGNISSGYADVHRIIQERHYLIPTASMCYRKEYTNMPSFFSKAPVGDKPLRLWCALNGRVYYFNDEMVVYRFYSASSFGLRVLQDKHLAQDVYERMIVFYDELNKYTHYKFNDDILLLKDKEEYFYYRRVGCRDQVIKSKYFSQLPLIVRIKFIIKTLIINIHK